METTRLERIRQILDRGRKRTKEKFQRYKKKSQWNWPELHLYCGLCNLSTGLYIRCVVCMILYIIIIIMNGVMLYYIMDTGRLLGSMDISDLEEYFGVQFTGINFRRVKTVLTMVVTYMIVWIIVKTIYIMCLIATIYAIYNKKPKILKLVLLNNILNWILNIVFTIFGAVLTQVMSKTLVIICILFEGYNLLALASLYRQLRGKSKLHMNLNHTNSDIEETITPSTPPVYPQPEHSDQGCLETRGHCGTCSCNLDLFLPSASETRSISVAESSSTQTTQIDEEKVLNIKDVEIIFNQDQLIQQNNSVIETVDSVNEIVVARSQRLPRPRVLELPSGSLEKKVELSDVPVIYDQDQLNVGGSPVVERQENSHTLQ